MKKYLLVIVILVLSAVSVLWVLSNRSGQATDVSSHVSYNNDVRPILSDKCFLCHGPDANTRKVDLRLDIQETAYAELKKNKGHFAIVPGDPESSEMIKRVVSEDPSLVMPQPESHLPRLTADEVEILKQWIKEGAKYEKHWAFEKPQKSALPTVKNEDWPANEADYFLLVRMDKKGLKPNDEADAETLVKRAFVDLNGIAPQNDEISRWTQIVVDGGYEHLLDTLLNRKSYGEKMALFWMDLARYADSYGFQDDNIRTQWPWRDWTIQAFNNNLPYDEFLVQQIAGDLLPDANKETILATAFFRNHKYTEEGGVIDEEYRVSYNVDKTNTFGKAILGVTIECAQCHDHKYDPFSMEDYYRLYAFFNISREVGYEGDVSQSTPAKNPKLYISQTDRETIFSYINARDTSMLEVSVMGDADEIRKTFVLARGSYDSPTEKEVQPAPPKTILEFDSLAYPSNRLGLARWTVNKDNPLTARVFVNFIWQELFGRGLVSTSSDFGLQGELPTHPELLDWLAVDFMEHDWDIKYLMKKIMTSATYKQSSEIHKKHLEIDPDNLYLARAPRLRFKAEIVRDWILSSSGLLNPEIGGPSVKPYQPKGVWESTTSGRGVLARYKQDHGPDLYRRGLYTFIKLTAPPPVLMIFDGSNRDQCETHRTTTNTPLQALSMLNNPTVLEAARVLAQNTSNMEGTLEQKVEYIFEQILVRKPSGFEQNTLLDYCEQQREYFIENPDLMESTLEVGEYRQPDSEYNKTEAAALMKTILVVYNLEEAITKS